MKKKYLMISIFIFIVVGNSFTQNAFEDAFFLAFNRETLLQDETFRKFDNDPFNKSNILDIESCKSIVNGGKPLGGIPLNFLTYSSKQESDLYYGLVKNINATVDREATLHYMELFEETIGKYGELKVIFPKTHLLLANHDPLKFNDLEIELKQSFSDDLKNMLNNLVMYFENPRDSKYQSIKFAFFNPEKIDSLKFNSTYNIIYIGYQISILLINKSHPIEILNFLDLYFYSKSAGVNPQTNEIRENFGDLAHSLYLIQSNLRLVKSKLEQKNIFWVTMENFSNLNNDSFALKYFMGLLYQKDPDFWDKFTNKFNIGNYKEAYSKGILPIYKILTLINAQYNDENLYDGGFGDYMQLFYDIILVAHNLKSVKLIDSASLSSLQTTINIYKSIQGKDYSNLVSNITLLLENTFISDAKFKYLFPVLTKLIKYGEFMTSFVNAKNSDEYGQVIAKYVSPPNSYLEKRTKCFTVSVSAHPGIYTCMDYLNKKGGWVSGLTLPIGLECTFGLEEPNNSLQSSIDRGALERASGVSIGLFLQLIDLGAALNFRVSNDSTTELPSEIKLHQIFSPGGSINFGFYNRAVTIGLGYQLAPKLRKITKNGFETEERSDRIFIRLSWDLPLFIF